MPKKPQTLTSHERRNRAERYDSREFWLFRSGCEWIAGKPERNCTGDLIRLSPAWLVSMDGAPGTLAFREVTPIQKARVRRPDLSLQLKGEPVAIALKKGA